MPSIHRQPGRPYWFCAFSILESAKPSRAGASFAPRKRSDKKQALEICRAWHKAALKARNGKLSVDAAREVIAQGVSDVFTAANVESLPSASIKSWCETWPEAKAIETEESTHARYKRVIERFTGFLGEAKSKRDLSTLQASDVARFRDREAKELSRSTANLGVKVLRICFGEAVRQGLLTVNPAVRVKLLKSTAESKRRAFTLDGNQTHPESVRRRYRMARPRAVRSVSRPTARRLGKTHVARSRSGLPARLRSQRARPADASCSRWCNRSPITWHHCQRATIRTLSFSLSAASAKRTASLSNQFREILVEAGLVEPLPRGHKSTGKGRNQAREASEISFHSLRHSAVTMLKAAGVSDFIAREIVGHESAAVSRQYTHLTTDDKRAAMQRLPDVTNG